MKCHLCDKVALTQAGGKGFCKAHRTQSIAATVKECALKASQNGVDAYDRNRTYGIVTEHRALRFDK